MSPCTSVTLVWCNLVGSPEGCSLVSFWYGDEMIMVVGCQYLQMDELWVPVHQLALVWCNLVGSPQGCSLVNFWYGDEIMVLGCQYLQMDELWVPVHQLPLVWCNLVGSPQGCSLVNFWYGDEMITVVGCQYLQMDELWVPVHQLPLVWCNLVGSPQGCFLVIFIWWRDNDYGGRVSISTHGWDMSACTSVTSSLVQSCGRCSRMFSSQSWIWWRDDYGVGCQCLCMDELWVPVHQLPLVWCNLGVALKDVL